MKQRIIILILLLIVIAVLYSCISDEQSPTDTIIFPGISDFDTMGASSAPSNAPGVIVQIDEGAEEPAKGSAIIISYETDNNRAGTITGESSQRIRYGETVAAEVRAVPALGWKFLRWSDGSTNPVRAGDSYKIDVTLTAYFAHDKLNMPTLSISTNDRSIGDNYVNTEISVNYIKPDITRDYQAQIRVRGANSRSYPKLSYKIRLDDRHNLLDIMSRSRGNRHYALIAVWNDYSLMRTPMGFELMSQLNGIPFSPDYTYVEVYFNDIYAGVYLLAEDNRVDENRIDINDRNAGDTNSFLVASAPGRELQLTYYSRYDGGYYGVRDERTFGSMRVRSQVYNQQQLNFVQNTLNAAWDSISDKATAERHFDMASLVDVYIAAEIMKGLDIAWNNHFWMHYDESTGKAYFTSLWDLKFGGGNHSGHNGFWASYEGLGMIAAQGQWGQFNRWFIALMQQTWFRESVQERFAEIDEVLDSIVPFLRATHELHRVSFERNFVRWPEGNIGTDSNFTPRQVVALRNHAENAEYLVNWMEHRISWLRAYIGSAEFISHAGTTNPGPTTP